MIIPPERFRDEELFVPKKEFEKENHIVTIASTKIGTIKGSRGGEFECTKKIENLKTTDFDVLVFVGGGGSKLRQFKSEVREVA